MLSYYSTPNKRCSAIWWCPTHIGKFAKQQQFSFKTLKWTLCSLATARTLSQKNREATKVIVSPCLIKESDWQDTTPRGTIWGPGFFRCDISVIFLLGHFGHLDVSVICLTVVLKLAEAVFISLYFQTFWPKWVNFSGYLENISDSDRKK